MTRKNKPKIHGSVMPVVGSDVAVVRSIFTVGGEKVIIDRDLADLYGVSTKRLNEQVKHNRERFPEDFMFQLSENEKAEVVAICDHSRLKYSHSLPYVFTEHGAIMAACVLNTPHAIEIAWSSSAHLFACGCFLRELLPAHGHRVIEIAAVRLENGMTTETFHTLIDCGRSIPDPACRIHGITDKMLCACLSPEAAFKDFRISAGSAALIAHKAPFDRSFLQHEYGRLGWALQNRMLCTLELSRSRLPQLPNHRLETVARHLFGNLPAGTRLHRALEDARLRAKMDWRWRENKRKPLACLPGCDMRQSTQCKDQWMMDKILTNLWAKTDRGDDARWHPLILHLLDVAASADAILAREPESTRKRMAAIFGMAWEDARAWFLLVVACHDLGKACPGFQCKWPKLLHLTGLRLPRSPNTEINHAFVSQIALSELLRKRGWPEELAELIADAIGCHHGERASPTTLDNLGGDERAIGRDDWSQGRQRLVEALLKIFKPAKIPAKQSLSGTDFMLLSGITSFSDWIGSNETWFPFGSNEDCEDLQGWFQKRRVNADQALDAIGWESRTPLSPEPKSFEQVFGFAPRPLQQAVADSLVNLKDPAILLVEAPMGEGKTEAAFFAHLELQRHFGHRGLYVALPTKATGNAMFKRTLKFLRDQGTNRKLDLQLLHGATLLSDTYQNLRLSGIHDSSTNGEIRAGEWFTHKKRALLSEYGVGTVDQALLPILPVRHNFVRLWGLANRVVVFDEIHAYDAYTGTLLVHLLRWLLELGSSVVLLSATLPLSIRRKLADAVKVDLPQQETEYPRLSVFYRGGVDQRHFEADPERRRTLRVQGIPPDLPIIRSVLEEHLATGGMALALVNTVQRAQDLYRLFPEGEPLERGGQRVGKRLSDGLEVFLFHARFPANRRQKREDQVLETFGENGSRTGRKILIATQVAEQSLDLDFDLIITDLAPIDLILQRAGRLWRHARKFRPISEPILLVTGLAGEEPPSFGKPLWWGAVYREDLLLRTWSLLHRKHNLMLPDEIDPLVQAVYEEQEDVPESLRERLEKGLEAGDGKTIAYTGQAHQAIIGLPDDASWNDPARFVLHDEDEPGMHRTLMARTRLGEDSIVVVPISPEDGFNLETTPDFAQAKEWFLQAVSLSRKGIVMKLKQLGVPEGWKKSPLLRNCFPLVLSAEGRWMEDAMVRLDDDLGIVYESKEAE